MSQLLALVKPFPRQYVHENPSGNGRGSYVAHDVVVQKLLGVVGPFDFEVREVLRGDTKAGQTNVVVGAICRLTVDVDGRRTSVEEVGDCENPANWPHDGARMKDAVSDAIKRCAMRLGVALHLWSGDEFFLYERLSKAAPSATAQGTAGEAGTADPGSSAVPVNPAQQARERLKGNAPEGKVTP